MDLLEQINREADRCVKCGICLPHCPTYKLYRTESESPRGRIALIQGLASQQLSSDQAQSHLDHCLHCLACERSCPSSVNYSQLIDLSYQLKLRRSEPSKQTDLVSKLPYSSVSYPLYWLYRYSGVRPLARAVLGKKFRSLDDMLPKQPGPMFVSKPTLKQEARARVGLFTGCVARLTERTTLKATLKVLHQLQIEVVIPESQGCCGAMQQHQGEQQQSDSMTENNRRAFNDFRLDAILYTASGCGAQLKQHQSQFDAPVMEVCEFINQPQWRNKLALKSRKGDLELHTPCSLKPNTDARELLGLIPDLNVRDLPNPDCCGAGGRLMLDYPELANELREKTLNSLSDPQPNWLATSNSGCAMHLRAGLRQTDANTKLTHPIEVIAEQLDH